MMSKILLQILTAGLALVPLLTGLAGLLLGVSELRNFSPVTTHDPQFVIDSNYRFFSGLWIAIGLCLMLSVRSIEYETTLFRVAWGAIFLGGIGRLVSIGVAGMPPAPFLGFTALEIIGAPLFIYWQSTLARS
jgi:Domain of unknown function (DUF4345)